MAGHHLVGELGDDSRIGRVGGLAGTEDVEVAEADSFETISSIEGLDIVLAGQLLDCVGGERTGKHVLLLGLRGLVAVGRGRGGVDDSADSGITSSDK